MRVKWNRQLDGSLSRRHSEENPPQDDKESKRKDSPKIFRLFRRKKHKRQGAATDQSLGGDEAANSTVTPAPSEADDYDCESISSVATVASQPVSEVCHRDRTLSLFSSFRISLPGGKKKPKRAPLPVAPSDSLLHPKETENSRYSSPDLRRDARTDPHLSKSSPSVRNPSTPVFPDCVSLGELRAENSKSLNQLKHQRDVVKSVSFSDCQAEQRASLHCRNDVTRSDSIFTWTEKGQVEEKPSESKRFALPDPRTPRFSSSDNSTVDDPTASKTPHQVSPTKAGEIKTEMDVIKRACHLTSLKNGDVKTPFTSPVNTHKFENSSFHLEHRAAQDTSCNGYERNVQNCNLSLDHFTEKCPSECEEIVQSCKDYMQFSISHSVLPKESKSMNVVIDSSPDLPTAMVSASTLLQNLFSISPCNSTSNFMKEFVAKSDANDIPSSTPVPNNSRDLVTNDESEQCKDFLISKQTSNIVSNDSIESSDISADANSVISNFLKEFADRNYRMDNESVSSDMGYPGHNAQNDPLYCDDSNHIQKSDVLVENNFPSISANNHAEIEMPSFDIGDIESNRCSADGEEFIAPVYSSFEIISKCKDVRKENNSSESHSTERERFRHESIVNFSVIDQNSTVVNNETSAFENTSKVLDNISIPPIYPDKPYLQNVVENFSFIFPDNVNTFGQFVKCTLSDSFLDEIVSNTDLVHESVGDLMPTAFIYLNDAIDIMPRKRSILNLVSPFPHLDYWINNRLESEESYLHKLMIADDSALLTRLNSNSRQKRLAIWNASFVQNVCKTILSHFDLPRELSSSNMMKDGLESLPDHVCGNDAALEEEDTVRGKNRDRCPWSPSMSAMLPSGSSNIVTLLDSDLHTEGTDTPQYSLHVENKGGRRDSGIVVPAGDTGGDPGRSTTPIPVTMLSNVDVSAGTYNGICETYTPSETRKDYQRHGDDICNYPNEDLSSPEISVDSCVTEESFFQGEKYLGSEPSVGCDASDSYCVSQQDYAEIGDCNRTIFNGYRDISSPDRSCVESHRAGDLTEELISTSLLTDTELNGCVDDEVSSCTVSTISNSDGGLVCTLSQKDEKRGDIISANEEKETVLDLDSENSYNRVENNVEIFKSASPDIFTEPNRNDSREKLLPIPRKSIDKGKNSMIPSLKNRPCTVLKKPLPLQSPKTPSFATQPDGVGKRSEDKQRLNLRKQVTDIVSSENASFSVTNSDGEPRLWNKSSSASRIEVQPTPDSNLHRTASIIEERSKSEELLSADLQKDSTLEIRTEIRVQHRRHSATAIKPVPASRGDASKSVKKTANVTSCSDLNESFEEESAFIAPGGCCSNVTLDEISPCESPTGGVQGLQSRCASLPLVIGQVQTTSPHTSYSIKNKDVALPARKSLIPRKQTSVRGVHTSSTKPVRPPMWLSKAELTQEIQRLSSLCEVRTKELNRLKMETKHVSVGFDAFASLFKYMVEDLNALSVPKLSADLQKTLKQLELAKQDLAYYEREVEELKAHHCQELNDLSNKLFEVFQGEVTELSTKHQEEMNRLKSDHQKQIENLTKTLNASSAESIAQHEALVTKLQQELISQREELQLLQEREIIDLEEKHSQSTKTLQEHIEQLQKKCAELKQHSLGMEDAMRKDTDSKLQWVTARKVDLEKEVESLKAVLEMKNKELHTIRVQNLEFEKHLEELPLAREKIKMLQARAEDLEALMIQKTQLERQLSTENQDMRETYEKESKINRRLSMENEELQWRLRQAEQSLIVSSFQQVPEYPEEEANDSVSPAKSPVKSPGPQAMSRSVFFTFVDKDSVSSPRSQYRKITPGFSASYKTSPAKSTRSPSVPSPRRGKSHSEPPQPPVLCSTPNRKASKQPSSSKQAASQKRQRSGSDCDKLTVDQHPDVTFISLTGSMASSLSSESSVFEHKEHLLEEQGEQIMHSLEILREQRSAESGTDQTMQSSTEEKWCNGEKMVKSLNALDEMWCHNSDKMNVSPSFEADMSRSSEFSDPKTYYHMTFPVLTKEIGVSDVEADVNKVIQQEISTAQPIHSNFDSQSNKIDTSSHSCTDALDTNVYVHGASSQAVGDEIQQVYVKPALSTVEVSDSHCEKKEQNRWRTI